MFIGIVYFLIEDLNKDTQQLKKDYLNSELYIYINRPIVNSRAAIQHSFPGEELGLYIASEIIQRLSGKIWVTSEENSGLPKNRVQTITFQSHLMR